MDRRLPARTVVSREQVYGRRPVREALRGRREVLELWATERAVKSEAWLRELERPRVQEKLDRDISEAAGTRDHQGVLAWCEPYHYADAYELAATERPLLACLDQVSDPRNLGAVCRSAEGAGATGVVVPAHGSARVTAAVCRSSAGAVEHLPVAVVTNLARYLEEIKSGDLWVAAAAGESGTPMWQADLSGGLAFVFGAEGKGLRPLVRRTCDLAVAIPQLGQVESLNVSVAAAVLLYEARRQTRWLSRRSISSTASTCVHAGGFGSPEELRNLLASWVAAKGARGIVVFDGHGPDEQHGPLAVRWAEDADTLIERLAAEHRRSEQVAVVSSDAAVRGTSGVEVRKLSSKTFLDELAPPAHAPNPPGDLRDRVDAATLAELERLRRGG